jgi:hypothetical protein
LNRYYLTTVVWRSDSGFFYQQLILAEGGFKIKLDTPYANQWMTTLNGGIRFGTGLNFMLDIEKQKPKRKFA